MPGPFTHIYTARRVQEFLASDQVTSQFVRDADGPVQEGRHLSDPVVSLFGTDYGGDGSALTKLCADAMEAWPKFTALGAIGPDLFFFMQDYKQPEVPCDEIMLAMSALYFWDDQARPDDDTQFDKLLAIAEEITGSTWIDILRLLLKLDRAWKKFMKVWNETVGQVTDAIGTVIDDMTGGMLTALGDALSELADAIVAVIAEELITKKDIFSWFALGMRSGYDEQAFLWSDMLHYRATSEVPRELARHAMTMLGDEDTAVQTHGQQLLAYALGWVCHVGTDTVAHPFINEQAGGPFRTHWQRHHLVENHVDAWNYSQTEPGKDLKPDADIAWRADYPSLNRSALYFAVQIPQDIDNTPGDGTKPAADDPRQGDWRRPFTPGHDQAAKDAQKEELDTDGALPTWLADLIVQVLIDVYGDEYDDKGKGAPTPPAGFRHAHPLNLLGSPFQDGLHGVTNPLGHWLGVLGLDNSPTAVAQLTDLVAPQPPFRVPEGFPLPWEVQASYRFMLSWFKRSFFDTFQLDKPRPPKIFTPPASDFDFGPPDFSGVGTAGDPLGDLGQLLLALLEWAWKSLKQAAQAAYDIAKSAASAATQPIRQAIYDNVTLPAWQVAENVRMVLGHLGYVMPQSQALAPDGFELRPSEIDTEIITLGHGVESGFAATLAGAMDIFGNLDHAAPITDDRMHNPRGREYPYLPVRAATADEGKPLDVVEYRRVWAYPDVLNDGVGQNPLETPLTSAGPYEADALPDVLFATDGPASNWMRHDYEHAPTPAVTDRLSDDYIGHGARGTDAAPAERGQLGERGDFSTNPLGAPVPFSAYLIGQLLFNDGYGTDFNLDADRGYGYRCWDWVRAPETDNDPTDPRGHRYQSPDTPPEDAPGWQKPGPGATEDPTPLETHYLGGLTTKGGQ